MQIGPLALQSYSGRARNGRELVFQGGKKGFSRMQKCRRSVRINGRDFRPIAFLNAKHHERMKLLPR